MALDNEVRTTRRGVLAAAVGGAGALLVSRIAQPGHAAAADNGNALLGVSNQSTIETGFENTDAGEVSVHVIQTTGTAIKADVTNGNGIQSTASGSGMALLGSSATGTGAWISSDDPTPTLDFTPPSHKTGIVATAGDASTIAPNTDETGLYGFSDTSINSNGVWGDSFNGTGVFGTGSYGVYGAGYIGVSGIGDHYGLYGAVTNVAAYALFTNGKIKFNGRSGRTTITAGHAYKDVLISGMTSASAVIVTLQTYKAGYTVAAAISYSGKFRMYLNKAAIGTMYFSYLVIG